jgi:hypothetical protein
MAGYLTTSLMNFTRRDIDGYNVTDYTSINFTDVHAYVNSLPDSMTDWYQVQNNDKFERIALELYGNADYWDILLVINHRNPLTGLPFDFDTISNLAEDAVEEYEADIYNATLPDAEHIIMYNEYEEQSIIKNELNRVIKIIRPSQINTFLQDGYNQGVF